jgi:hypothetical protein
MAMGVDGLRGLHSPDPPTFAAGRTLAAGGGNPLHTPALRRTGPLAAYQEPKKNSVVGTILGTLALLGVIGYGGYKLRPVYDDMQKLRNTPAGGSNETPGGNSATPADASTAVKPTVAKPADSSSNEEYAEPKDSHPVATSSAPTFSGAAPVAPVSSVSALEGNPERAGASTIEAKSVEPISEKSGPKRIEPVLNPRAAQFKQQIEQAIADRNLTGKAKVQGVNNTLILAGKLHPAEHGALLKLLRNAPAEVRVVDHIEYDDAPVDAAAGGGDDSHPVPGSGRGAIHVVTDVIGASAVLHGPRGRVLNQCQTPCSFNNLFPAQYSLEVNKDGYQPVQTAMQVTANTVSDQKLLLESLAQGLFLSSEPAGAEVFINGAKQSGQTPVTLPLAPGQYNLVLRLQGYEAYSGTVQVKDNVQTRLATKLMEKSNNRVAWAQVDTNPKGAEIFVDDKATGKITPARVEVPIGMHSLTLTLDGFHPAKRTVEVSDGGTVNIHESLKPN